MLRPGPAAAQAPAPYATRPGESRGRVHPEPASPSRTEFQRDRDRIIHSTAFRRLQHKTQVFVYHVGDHYRTRLTHSIEVAQIARSAARRLGLDEDLAEAVGLAHDLGHPPFGHAGEEALNAAMTEWGGFDHNAQTLQIVTRLERRYAAFDGLNLTWEALEGMVKHNGPLTGPLAGPLAGPSAGPRSAGKPLPEAIESYVAGHDLELDTFAGPEAQIAALADDIAYISHDLDDGVRAGLFALGDLADVPLAGPAAKEVNALYPGLETPRATHETVRRLIDRMLADMVEETGRRAERSDPRSAADVRALAAPLVAFAPAMAAEVRNLRAFLYQNMYGARRVRGRAEAGMRIVADLFQHYRAAPSAMPPEWQPGANTALRGAARRVADFIAGMTDRYAIDQYREHIPKPETVLRIL